MGRFKYKGRSRDQVRKRIETSGRQFDSILKDQFPQFRPKEGSYQIRIMPPTWDDPEHYGFDVHVHMGVGPDNESYICPWRQNKESCPICDERKAAEKDNDEEYVRQLYPSRRVLVWIIDRDAEDDGPKIWAMPQSVDSEILELTDDPRTGEVLPIDSPEDGYDVMFTRKGSGLKTKYTGIKTAKRESPLCDDEKLQDEWLDYIMDNPLPGTLNIQSATYIANVFSGEGSSKEEDEDRPARRRRRGSEDEDERPARRRRGSEKEEPEEEEDEQPKRGRRRATSKDEEDEDERPKRGRRRAVEKEEPEDEEDEQPKRGRRRRAAADEEPEDEREGKERLSRTRRRRAAREEDED